MTLEQLNNYFKTLLLEKGYELCELTLNVDSNEKTLHFGIDKIDGVMDLDTTVVLSEIISDELDKLNFIEDSYTLDVSSAGAERPIPIDNLERFKGKYINIHVTNPINGENYLEGELQDVNDEEITILIYIKARKKIIKVLRNTIDKARLAIKF